MRCRSARSNVPAATRSGSGRAAGLSLFHGSLHAAPGGAMAGGGATQRDEKSSCCPSSRRWRLVVQGKFEVTTVVVVLVVVPSPSWPEPLRPQQRAVPSEAAAQVW